MPDFPEVGYGTVHGRFLAGIHDTVDPGEAPDVRPMAGEVEFWPTADVVLVGSSTPPVTLMPQVVCAPLDFAGYITNPDTGARDVNLFCNDDPDGNPVGWHWRAVFKLTLDGRKAERAPFYFALPCGTTVDLTTVAPVYVGEDGIIIIRGPQGPPGPQGEPGDGFDIKGTIPVPGPPAFPGEGDGDLWIDSDGNGWAWDATSGSWVNLGPIQGPQGEQGEPGAVGPVGPAGPEGAQGPIGLTGPEGLSGPQGPAGPAGADSTVPGPVGPTGPAGAPGADSTVPGPTGPEGPTGPQGAAGADSTVPGPTGPAGPEGPKGDTGDTGLTGPAGADSTVPGPTGPAGPQGEVGATGAPGADSVVPGPTGPQGVQGEVGPTGPQGDVGPQGIQGATGPAGPEGPEGPIGLTGPTGPQGDVGLTGPAGADSTVPGPIGPQGDIGATGATGPTGPEGPEGDVGPVGPQGPKGDAGSGVTIIGTLPGQGPPPGSGEVGDMWLDVDGNGWVWDGDSWVNVGPIRGPEGPQGATGAQGPVGPAGADGEDSTVPGPTGPVGPQGEAGPQGIQGEVGPTGATGAPGADSTVAGPVGPQGPQGEVGPTGLTGPEGPKGDTGDAGATGAQGPVGADGAVGPTGPEGPQGDVGPQGVQGEVGATGAPGADSVVPGPTGPEGPQGPIGLTGPQGEIGPQGVPGADSTVAGPVGPQGIQGETGLTGATGPEGPEGPQGPIGLTGETGATGAAGATGPAGADGATGPAGADSTVPGPQGPEGPAGVAGPKGDTGDAGAVGATGPAGADSTVPGPVGPAGPQGEVGPTGAQGLPGNDGAPGATGPAGADSTVPGPTGPAGPQGEVGPTGAQGLPGNDGAPGATGPAGADSTVPGPTGPAGPQGEVGATGAQGIPGNDGAPGATGPAGADSTVPGPTGPAGPQGEIGATGPQGIPGNDGATGATGPAGADSTVPGPTGPAGPQGEIGPTGAQGVPGNDGAPGATGPAGADSTVPGPTGPQGPAGPAGPLVGLDEILAVGNTSTRSMRLGTAVQYADVDQYNVASQNAGVRAALDTQSGPALRLISHEMKETRLLVNSSGSFPDVVLPAESGTLARLEDIPPAGVTMPTALAKGDLLVASGPGAWAILPVGADGEVLIADSTMPLGMKWGTAVPPLDATALGAPTASSPEPIDPTVEQTFTIVATAPMPSVVTLKYNSGGNWFNIIAMTSADGGTTWTTSILPASYGLFANQSYLMAGEFEGEVSPNQTEFLFALPAPPAPVKLYSDRPYGIPDSNNAQTSVEVYSDVPTPAGSEPVVEMRIGTGAWTAQTPLTRRADNWWQSSAPMTPAVTASAGDVLNYRVLYPGAEPSYSPEVSVPVQPLGVSGAVFNFSVAPGTPNPLPNGVIITFVLTSDVPFMNANSYLDLQRSVDGARWETHSSGFIEAADGGPINQRWTSGLNYLGELDGQLIRFRAVFDDPITGERIISNEVPVWMRSQKPVTPPQFPLADLDALGTPFGPPPWPAAVDPFDQPIRITVLSDPPQSNPAAVVQLWQSADQINWTLQASMTRQDDSTFFYDFFPANNGIQTAQTRYYRAGSAFIMNPEISQIDYGWPPSPLAAPDFGAPSPLVSQQAHTVTVVADQPVVGPVYLAYKTSADTGSWFDVSPTPMVSDDGGTTWRWVGFVPYNYGGYPGVEHWYSSRVEGGSPRGGNETYISYIDAALDEEP